MRSLRLARLTALVVLSLASSLTAHADTKSEMIAIIDKIGANKPGAEALIDWDNLVVKSPQIQGMDVHKMYSGFDAANKKAFRESFLRSFSQSFQQKAKGHTFAEAVKTKGAAVVVKDKGSRPSFRLRSKGGGFSMSLGYVRKHGKLQLQSINAGS